MRPSVLKPAPCRGQAHYEQGQYVMYVWVPVKKREVAKETEIVLKGNRFAILAAESGVHQGFTRRV